MKYSDLECLEVSLDDGVATVAIDHPPLNLFDLPLIRDMDALARKLEADRDVRVAVIKSANPDFFIAHADVEMISQQQPSSRVQVETPNGFQQMTERFRRLPQVTIGQIEGRARGGGSEFLLALDMRFAAIGSALLSQPEVALGIIPGGGGTQRLPRVLGRARALEIVLGCEDFDAELAERYGYINRALPAKDIERFVQRLARRIAGFPPAAVARAKAAVDAVDVQLSDGLATENHHFERTLADPETRKRMARFLANGGQTPAGEKDLDKVLGKL